MLQDCIPIFQNFETYDEINLFWGAALGYNSMALRRKTKPIGTFEQWPQSSFAQCMQKCNTKCIFVGISSAL